MKRNNKALYERIMSNVSREVKKALTESMITESWGGLNAADDAQWNEWWEEYVPSEGKCDTVGGEIMRAMSRIVYRYYNDGDTVEEYYACMEKEIKPFISFIEEQYASINTKLDMLMAQNEKMTELSHKKCVILWLITRGWSLYAINFISVIYKN